MSRYDIKTAGERVPFGRTEIPETPEDTRRAMEDLFADLAELLTSHRQRFQSEPKRFTVISSTGVRLQIDHDDESGSMQLVEFNQPVRVGASLPRPLHLRYDHAAGKMMKDGHDGLVVLVAEIGHSFGW